MTADRGDISKREMENDTTENVLYSVWSAPKQSDDVYTKSVLIVCAVSCLLSIFGSLVIFGTYLCMPEIRNFTRKLIVSLTVADILTSGGFLLATSQFIFGGSSGGTNVCLIQSYITTFSSLVSFLLTIMTAVHIFITVVKQPDFPSKQRLVLFNTISWIVPAVVIAVAGSQKVLGGTGSSGTGPWCWIKITQKDRVMWQLVTGKAWEITCYIVTTSLYVLLKLYLFTRHRYERFRTFHSSLRDEDQNFLYVWLIFYIIRLWGTIRFFISAVKPSIDMASTAMNILLHLQAFGDPAQAFCNSILFCLFDKTVRRRLCSRFSGNICDYRELREPLQEDTGSFNSSVNVENSQQNKQLNSSDPINYGSTNNQRDENDDAYSCIYDSPLSTPCFTPRVLTPASFASLDSQG